MKADYKNWRGHEEEQRALRFLIQNGLTLRTRNFRCRYGEIDLILQEKACIVFVEVRFRASTTHGHAIETVDRRKQKKVIKSAITYLHHCHMRWDEIECRFDVVGLSYVHIEWIKNAFSWDVLNDDESYY